MKTVKNNASKKAVKKTAKVLVKKTAVKSESVILKSALNNEWKKETFSMSGLVRYAKGKGEEGLNKYIAHYNKNKGSNANDDKTKGAEFIKGEAKIKFSYWLLLQTVGRLAKQELAK